MSELNTSGFKPYDIGVLVRIEKKEEKKIGSLIMATNINQATQTATNTPMEPIQTGTIVDMGGRAFVGIDSPPQLGDSVFFAKYSGQMLYLDDTADSHYYRAMDDHDIRLIRSK